nr:MAG TPA: terminase small subunit [Caudoviricetes sp.]
MMAHQRELDRKQFESLCGMQCSVEELCGWFGCDEAALNAWCMDTYGEDFRSAFDRLAMMGRIVLRREQVAAAKKNVSMARHLEAQRAGHDAPPQKRKNYRLTDAYKELRQSMLQNLIERDLDGDVYRDKAQEYMDFWVRRQELRDDIARRGLTVTDDRGRLMENRSVSLEIQVSRQMLAIFTTLGFKEDALSAAARGDDDDEL